MEEKLHKRNERTTINKEGGVLMKVIDIFTIRIQNMTTKKINPLIGLEEPKLVVVH